MNRVEFGATYRDKITGFRGVATGQADYIAGCSQVLLAPGADHNNALPDARWFDIQRLEPMPQMSKITIDNGAAPGADKPAPVR